MSIFNRALRPPPTVSDEVIERYLATIRAELDPDPLFQRRLRSDVVNRFVAAREGIESPARIGHARQQMGRLGRACLYASVTLGVSAASVMAVSQEALPGEAFYPLKQRIEQLRMDVVPAHLKIELAAYALGERIEEMGRLANTGRIELAVAMAPAIDREYARLGSLEETVDAAGSARIERHMLVLASLIERLPGPARAAVGDVIDGSQGGGRGIDHPPNGGNSGAANPGGGNGAAGSGSGPGATQRPDSTSKPAATEKPNPAANPHPTTGPEPNPKPDRTPNPRTPRPEPPAHGANTPSPPAHGRPSDRP